MSKKTISMFVLTAIAIVLYATRFVPAIGMSPNVSDFFGGAAFGLGFGAIVSAYAERA